MRIDHRWARRQSANLNVTIAPSTGSLLRGRVHNISSRGALVQTSAPLEVYAQVELILPAFENDTMHLHRLRATVARAENDTVGLTFQDVEPQTLIALLKQNTLE